MDKLNYCLDCKRIFSAADGCTYCSSKSTKELPIDSPVNVIGSKLKGRVYKTGSESLKVLFVDDHKNRSIREYKVSEVRKVL